MTAPDREPPKTDAERTFEETWRHRAHRPPELSSRAAAERVLARIAEQDDGDGAAPRRSRRLPPTTRWLVAAGVAAALLAAVLLHQPATPPTADPGAAPPAAGRVAGAGTAVQDDVVVLWLDPETPLYLTLAPPRPREATAR